MRTYTHNSDKNIDSIVYLQELFFNYNILKPNINARQCNLLNVTQGQLKEDLMAMP